MSMTRCPRCGKMLALQETVQAMDGLLYCSRDCAIRDKAEELKTQVYDLAKEYFDEHAEEVATKDILSEDFQDVQIAVTYYKTVKLPKCLTEEKALRVVEDMWNAGKVNADPDDCEDVRFECVLVTKYNSTHGEADTYE